MSYLRHTTCESKTGQNQQEKYFPCLSAQLFCSCTEKVSESQKVLLNSSYPTGKLPLYLFFSSSVKCSVRIFVTTFTLFAMYTFKKKYKRTRTKPKKHHRLKKRAPPSKAQIQRQNKAAWICPSLTKVLIFNILVINRKCCTLIFLFALVQWKSDIIYSQQCC